MSRSSKDGSQVKSTDFKTVQSRKDG
ncbi:hypothetical protein OOU_Y34scaffold00858g3 [Pyricularia oryzae Y34]|uniref:Uncharacterized protein n=2 Tax=Pyricularia oryzae TaxID=318829 RepID=A0AA97NNH1_PYRO3|nr:hypothetical protein OOU_Y34scaffold00960g1 [Pyricularia oryzae Y34]ELQ33862.1 hypothetical protein OOU_Y34scaffold00858g3 [Pyricularia oryzae Y34]